MSLLLARNLRKFLEKSSAIQLSVKNQGRSETLIEIANALSVSVDVLLCDNVLASQNIFKGEAKEIFEDCDEYETRFLVDLLKCAKSAMRRDKEVRNQFNR